MKAKLKLENGNETEFKEEIASDNKKEDTKQGDVEGIHKENQVTELDEGNEEETSKKDTGEVESDTDSEMEQSESNK